MLKKVGIIVAAAAVGVLAVTSFAFANDDEASVTEITNTIVEEGNLANDCPIGQEGGTFDQNLLGGDSLLGAAGAVTGAITPLTTQTQTGNCTNVGLSDLIDSGSNNTSRTVDETEIDDSFNTELDD